MVSKYQNYSCHLSNCLLLAVVLFRLPQPSLEQSTTDCRLIIITASLRAKVMCCTNYQPQLERHSTTRLLTRPALGCNLRQTGCLSSRIDNAITYGITRRLTLSYVFLSTTTPAEMSTTPTETTTTLTEMTTTSGETTTLSVKHHKSNRAHPIPLSNSYHYIWFVADKISFRFEAVRKCKGQHH